MQRSSNCLIECLSEHEEQMSLTLVTSEYCEEARFGAG